MTQSSAGHGAIELTEIVAYLDERGGSVGTLAFSLALASEHGAHLTGVFLQPEPQVSPAATFSRGQGIDDVISAYQAQLGSIEAESRASFEDGGRRHGVPNEWRLIPHLDTDGCAVHARYGDLAVVARRDATDRQGPPGLVECLVLTSGRPTIVLPPRSTAPGLSRVLVGWNARREAARAVADALPLLVRAEAVEILVVDGKSDRAGHGQEPGADVARYLARHDVAVEVRRVASGGEDVGRILLSRAGAFGADLLVMGAYGHSQLSEWVFGGVTRRVLHEAELPVLMSR